MKRKQLVAEERMEIVIAKTRNEWQSPGSEKIRIEWLRREWKSKRGSENMDRPMSRYRTPALQVLALLLPVGRFPADPLRGRR